MSQAYQFGEFKLRPAVEGDRELAAAWLAADPAHQDTKADFFLGPQALAEPLLLEQQGEPVFFFKLRRALRIDIQFGPITAENRERHQQALLEGFAWLRERALASGFRQLIFQSQSAPLVRFCCKRLGFRMSAGELVCDLGGKESEANS